MNMIESVELGKITSEGNRKNAKDESFEQLVNSIKEHGILEPPVVRKLPAPQIGYKVVAGRRRVEAVRQLNKRKGGVHAVSIDCMVIDPDDPRSDEEIALAENVNRLEMHPLDESALFARMADKGMSVEEIAKYYARSPSAIYKRLRLRTLIDELKGMFRKGQINIGGAAVLAELPEEDQKEFFNLNREYEVYDENDEIEAIKGGDITEFLYKKQKNIIKENMSKICKNCAKRTHNEHNALFEEYRYLDDVCLDGECYRLKWYEMISAALKAQIVQMNEAGLKTDEKIFFAGDTVEQIYKRANKVRFKIGKEEIEFEVLSDKKYDRTDETNRKKDACWLIKTTRKGEGNERIDVRRVGYKEKEKTAEEESGSGKKSGKAVKGYGREALEVVAQELQMPSSLEAAIKLNEKHVGAWDFKFKIASLVFERIVAMRIEKDKKLQLDKKLPQSEYLELLLEALDENGGYGDNNYKEKMFNDFQKKCMKGLFGARSIKSISDEFDDDAQNMFHFLLVSTLSKREVPDLDEIKEIGKKDVDAHDWHKFWKYAAMSVEEYTAIYLQAAKDFASAALKPAEKKKKAEVKKKAKGKAQGVRACADDDNYPADDD